MDLIDRQAAIDALDEWEAGHSWDAWCYGHKDEAKKFHIDAPTAVIEKLPSAQPDIIRCKECKWKYKHICNRAVELWIDDDKYCAWAERRDADMREPMTIPDEIINGVIGYDD